MRKIILAATVAGVSLLLASCGDNRFSSPEERKAAAQAVIESAQRVCIDHVEYLSFPNSYGRTYTAHLQVDGKPFGC